MNYNKTLSKHIQVATYAAKNLIDNHPLNITKTNDLASAAGINRSLLQRGFKKLFGMGLREYQVKKRLEFAKDLLDQGNMSIKEISYRCSYRSQNSFTKAFKKEYGLSPKLWQNRHQ